MHIHDRHLLAPFVVAMGGDDHFAKILLVLNPVQFDLEAGELGFLNVAFLQKRVESSNDVLGAGSRRFALEMIEFDDHVLARALKLYASPNACTSRNRRSEPRVACTLRVARPFYLILGLRNPERERRSCI